MITLLIDGELHGVQKGYILDKLNSDGSLNQQFKLENAIHKATQAKPKVEPSEKLTNDLFDKLGFSNGNTEKPLIPWISTLKKASVFLAAGLALTLIGYYAFTSKVSTEKPKIHTLTEKKIPFVSSTSIVTTAKTVADENSDTKSIAGNKPSNNSKVNKTEKSANKTSKTAVSTSETTVNDSAERKEVQNDDNSLIAKSESEVSIQSAPSLEEISASALYRNTSSFGNLFDKQGGAFVFQLDPFKYNSRLMDQINRDNEISVKVMNPQQSNDFMTNGGFALTYYRKWKDGFKIGVEGGIENINRWSYDAQNGSKSLSNSQALSLSGILRYDAEFLKYANINPFVQTFFGFGTNFNYLYGGTVGLMYNPPLTRFGIQAGYEYRKFDYYFGSDNTSTMSFEKSGATVSLIIKF